MFKILYNSVFAAIRVLLGCVGFLLVAQTAMGAAPDAPYRITVFLSHDADAYQSTLKGIRQRFAQEGIPTNWDVYQMGGNKDRALPGIADAKTNETKLIIALGAIATEAVCREITRIPIVVGLLLKTDCLVKSANATGVTLAFSPELSLQWIQKTLPTAKNVGVLYNPVENQSNIEKARQAAERLGMMLYAQAVRKPKELPGMLKKIMKKSDVIWGLPDSLILNPQTAKTILLSSFRNRIPFAGPSVSWAKAGAFQALGHDYVQIGDQCAGVAIRILKGENPNRIPILTSENARCYINQKTANHLKIRLPDPIRVAVTILE